MSRKESDKEKLWNAGIKASEPLKWKEFKCPCCGGVATIGTYMSLTTAECHACGLMMKRGVKRWRV